jgi:hypothetical protein
MKKEMKKKDLDSLQGIVVSCMDPYRNQSGPLYEGDIIIRKHRGSKFNCTFGIFLKAVLESKPSSYFSHDEITVYWIPDINNQSDIAKTFELWNNNKLKANQFKQETYTYLLPNYYIQARSLKDFLSI